MSAHYNVSDVVYDATQFQSGRFVCVLLVSEMLGMGNNVSSISHYNKTPFSCANIFLLHLPINMSPTFVCVNLVGIIRLSIQVKNTALG